jgi:hypothetical protein
MENLHFWDTPADSSVFYKELIKNNGHYVNAEITLYDDDGTGTDEFKIIARPFKLNTLISSPTIVVVFKNHLAHFHQINPGKKYSTTKV